MITFTSAGLPEAAARSSAGRICSGSLDELAVAAERLHHLVVAGVGELGRGEAIPAVDGALRPHHLAPGGVVADDADDRQLEAHGGVELEAVQAEGAVAVDDHDALASGCASCAASAKGAPTPSVPSGPGSIQAPSPFTGRIFAAVATMSPPSPITIGSPSVVEPVAHLAAHALRVDRHLVAVRAPPRPSVSACVLDRAQLVAPAGEVELHALVLHLLEQQLEAAGEVADQADVASGGSGRSASRPCRAG